MALPPERPNTPSSRRLKKELKYVKERKRELRKNSTPTERRMWEKLRAKRFFGYIWRRQHNVDDYYLDFYCPRAKLAVELDGEIHGNQEVRQHDIEKTHRLNKLGIHILHFANIQIFRNWKNVEEQILDELKKRIPN